MKRAIFALSILVLVSVPARAVKIDRIEIEGNIHVNEHKIRSILNIRAGDELKASRVTEGLKNLFQTKNFSDVRAGYYEDENGDVVVVIEVEEHPRVKQIRIRGNDKIKGDDISAKLRLREGYFARPSMINDDIRTIKEMYGEEGYNQADVEVEKSPQEDEHKVIVTYSIREGKKIKIRHIDFIGNGEVSSEELMDVMESREDRWWRGGEYKQNILDEDLKNIKKLYEDRGFLDASVKLGREVDVGDGSHVDLYIEIDEGYPYFINSLTWSGNTVIPDEEIEEMLEVERGAPFSVEEIGMRQVALNSLYWEKGYIWSRIIPERRVFRRRIDLNLLISENNPAYINEIKISGNDKTFENVIRRELEVYPGDKFILTDVQRGVRDIFQMGYFNGPPLIDTEPATDEGDINLLIKVEEKQTGNFKMGFGFSQLNSLSGFLGVEENNFLGRGKSIGVDWEFGRYRKNLVLRYTEPHLLGTDASFTVELFDWIQDRVRQLYYTDRRRGFSLRAGHPMPLLDYTRVYLGYRFETVKIYDFSTAYPEYGTLRMVDWPLNKSSVTLSFTRNSTDSPFHPTRGSVSTVSAEFAGGPMLGGNVRFNRYITDLSWFRGLFWKLVFHLNMRAGLIDSKEGVQDYERFRLGGNRTNALRGYDFYEIVPEGNDYYSGGRFMTTFVQELLFPFANEVYGLVFLDLGNTWNSFQEANLYSLKRGLGLGVRIEMAGLGNLGFDYGYGFDKVDGPAWEPHFTFGRMF